MGTVYLDQAQLRHIAERLLGDREFDYLPGFNKAVEDLQADTALVDFGAGGDGEELGFVEGMSGIGKFHTTCINDVLGFFTNLDRGLVAMSNVLASVAEDFTETDVNSEASTSAIMQYFTPEDQSQGKGRGE